MEILQRCHSWCRVFSRVYCLSNHGKCSGWVSGYNRNEMLWNCPCQFVCCGIMFKVRALCVLFLPVQTTTISVFFSEKCNSVSRISRKPRICLRLYFYVHSYCVCVSPFSLTDNSPFICWYVIRSHAGIIHHIISYHTVSSLLSKCPMCHSTRGHHCSMQ